MPEEGACLRRAGITSSAALLGEGIGGSRRHTSRVRQFWEFATSRTLGDIHRGRDEVIAQARLHREGDRKMAESRHAGPAIAPNRWLQLGLGILCMSMIANLQYGWTL